MVPSVRRCWSTTSSTRSTSPSTRYWSVGERWPSVTTSGRSSSSSSPRRWRTGWSWSATSPFGPESLGFARPTPLLFGRPSGGPRERGAATVLGHLLRVAGLALDHATTAVDGDLAAFLEHGAELLAPTLHARLHSRQGRAEHLGGL